MESPADKLLHTLGQLAERLRQSLRPAEDATLAMRDALTYQAASLTLDAEGLFYRDDLHEKDLTALLQKTRQATLRHKKQLAAEAAELQHKRQQLRQALEQVRAYEDRSDQALRERRLDLYDEALQRRDEHAARASELEASFRASRPAVAQARAALHRLDNVLEMIACRRHILHAARSRRESQASVDSLSRALETQATQALLQELGDQTHKVIQRATTEHTRLTRRLEHTQTMATQWDQKAHKALGLGHPDAAEDALQRHIEHSDLAARYAAALQEHQSPLDQVQSTWTALQTELKTQGVTLAEADPPCDDPSP